MSLLLNKLCIFRHQQPLLSLSVSVSPGEVVSVMGPSGAGKSTLLDVIIGQVGAPFSYTGDIILNQKTLNDVPAHQRNIGMLYQDALLFEHLSVGDNIAFALPHDKQHAMSRKQRRDMIASQLGDVGLGDLYDRPVQTLSGGQQARVSLLRTMAASPQAVLLDEPFGKLDEARKDQLREWVFTLLADKGLPALMVTHDANDARAAGGKIVEV